MRQGRPELEVSEVAEAKSVSGGGADGEGAASAPSLRRRPFQVGAWSVDPTANCIFHGEERHHLEPKVMGVLLYLSARPGRVVGKQALLEAVWPGTFVSEVSLPRSISALRRALQDDARQPLYIETIPKRGYRLIAPVSEAGAEDVDGTRRRPWAGWAAVSAGLLTLAAVVAAAVWQRPARPSMAIDSLAVLPLRSLSPEPEEEDFADALTDLLITDLAKLGAFRVISGTSVMRYREARPSVVQIARELGVDAVVEGTVVRSDGRLRVTVKLLEGASGETLWTDSYEHAVDDLLALQRTLARSIARSLETSVPPEELARLSPALEVEPEAFDLYLKGRQLWRQRGAKVLEAIALFERSLEIDPGNALAHAGLADAYIVLSGTELPAEEAMPLARRAALEALQLDQQLAEAHVSLAMVRYLLEHDWFSAEEHFREGLRLQPGYATGHQWYGLFLASLGRFEEAVAEGQLATELDPFSAQTRLNAGRVLFYAGRLEEALEELRLAGELDPTLGETASYFASYVALLRGSSAQATETIATYLAQEDCGCSSGVAAADRLGASPGCVDRYYHAVNLALLGKLEPALACVAGVADGGWVVNLAVEPAFRALRPDPRFQQLLQQLGLDRVGLRS